MRSLLIHMGSITGPLVYLCCVPWCAHGKEEEGGPAGTLEKGASLLLDATPVPSFSKECPSTLGRLLAARPS